MKAKVICAVVALFLAGWMAGTARADFTLYGDEQLTVNTSHGQGVLWDQSCATIVPGGAVYSIDAYNSSTVCMSGGAPFSLYALSAYDTSTVVITGGETWSLYALSVYNSSTVAMSGGSVYSLHASDSSTVAMSGGEMYALQAWNSTTVDMSDGSVYVLQAWNSTTVDMSDGSVSTIDARDSSTVDISGGSMCYLRVYNTSTVTFDGQDFLLGTGLSLNGDRVLGTGILSGEWFDGTPWTVNITANDFTATILAIPEPGTLSLLVLLALSLPKRGGLALRRKSGYGG